MQYCQRCIMPTTRPGLKLDKDGICSACHWHEQKKTINWDARLDEFKEVVRWAKKTSRGPWDCVLGVSGGKDSTWQAMMVREKLGMEPLLVQFVSSDGTQVGRQNIENLVSLGFNLISMQPNPQIAQQLSKASFLNYGNVHKYAEMALFPIPFRMAMTYDIPLVLFGENPALEAGDTNSGEGWDATTIRNNHTLGGDGIDIWLSDGIRRKDLIQYQFPSEQEFQAWGGKGVFMGYYMNWSGWHNGIYAIENGMQCIDAPYEDIGIHYKHNSLDSEYGGIVNSMLKHLKFGFGNTTEFSCYDVRDGRISREEAAVLVRHLDGRCHERYVKSYCDWINLSVEEFWRSADRYRGECWQPDGPLWSLQEPIWEQVDTKGVEPVEAIIRRLDTRKRSLAV